MFDVRACLEPALAQLEMSSWLEPFAALARPTVLLDVVRDEAPVGATKIGGCPDLPSDVDWPRIEEGLVAFIAQVDLRDVAALDCLDDSQRAPAHGMLYCFAEQESSTPTHQLIYVPNPRGLTRRPVEPGELADPDQVEPFPEFVVSRLVPSASLPHWGPDGVPDEYFELVGRVNNLPERQSTSRLFGHPLDYHQKREDEEVIFHIESHFEQGAPPMNFWDAGYLEVTTPRGQLVTECTSTQARIFSM